MAIKQELVIEIGPDGEMRIKSHGFKGSDCEQELKPIEEAMGKVKSREKTSEYYEKPVTQKGKINTSTE